MWIFLLFFSFVFFFKSNKTTATISKKKHIYAQQSTSSERNTLGTIYTMDFWASNCKIINLVRSLIGCQIMTRQPSIVTPAVLLKLVTNFARSVHLTFQWIAFHSIQDNRFTHGLIPKLPHNLHNFIVSSDCFCVVLKFIQTTKSTMLIQMSIAEQPWQLKLKCTFLYAFHRHSLNMLIYSHAFDRKKRANHLKSSLWSTTIVIKQYALGRCMSQNKNPLCA